MVEKVNAAASIPCKLLGYTTSLRSLALCALTVQTTAAVILTRYSKMVDTSATLPYHSSSLVVTTEFLKLFLSLCLMYLYETSSTNGEQCSAGIDASKENGDSLSVVAIAAEPVQRLPLQKSHGHRLAQLKHLIVTQNIAQPLDTMKLAVPALLYTVQNNLIYVALANLEATTFQVGYQSKVITTAIMSVVMLNRTLSANKWIALVLLTVGIVITQMKHFPAGSPLRASSPDAGGSESSPYLGITAVLAAATCSAFAGVYFEKILKGTNPSVWMRNSQLAFFSSIIGIITFVSVEGASASFFQGYCGIVWAIILVQAGGGLIIAVVMKYADNILKGFATAISIILCGVISWSMMGFAPQAPFVVGSIIVIGATFLYSAN